MAVAGGLLSIDVRGNGFSDRGLRHIGRALLRQLPPLPGSRGSGSDGAGDGACGGGGSAGAAACVCVCPMNLDAVHTDAWSREPQQEELRLAGRGLALGDAMLVACCVIEPWGPAVGGSRITALDLSDNFHSRCRPAGAAVGAGGGATAVPATRKGKGVDAYAGCGDQAAAALGGALYGNTSLRRLVLCNAGLVGRAPDRPSTAARAGGFEALCAALTAHPALQELVLARNCLGAEGAGALGPLLHAPSALTKLDLSSNCIGPSAANGYSMEGMLILRRALKGKQFDELDLGDNGFENAPGHLAKFGAHHHGA
jgi:hypothetical protein